MLDSNVWLSTKLLRTPLGAAVLHLVHRLKARIALPEVVEKEVLKRGVELGEEAVAASIKALDSVSQYTGKNYPLDLPNKEQLLDLVTERMSTLEPTLVRIPITREHTRKALDRVIAGLPPTAGKREEFRDSLIWEAALESAREGARVFFISADPDFYASRDPAKGLAKNLKGEVAAENLDMVVLPDLRTCLEQLQAEAPTVDHETLSALISDELADDLNRSAARKSILVSDMVDHEEKVFATEDPKRLAVSFRQDYEIADPGYGGYRGPTYGGYTAEELEAMGLDVYAMHLRLGGIGDVEEIASVEGSCFYEPKANTISDLSLTNIDFRPWGRTAFARSSADRRLLELRYPIG